MTEWVVTTKDGKRHEVEADAALSVRETPLRWSHTFPGATSGRHWRGDVVLIQRRDGFRLEQVWPAA